ncbi:MAG: hypothetical protein M0Z33_06480 [Actinomycetota bacterium]|nr:hypothetical protein [Actinomycetota bacterium]
MAIFASWCARLIRERETGPRPARRRLAPAAIHRLAELVGTTELEGVYEHVFDESSLSHRGCPT